jgi:DNA-binding NtrC family response regulator
MHQIVVLAVGLGPSLLATQSTEWKSAGYIVQSASSIREAISHFKAGDFDLVLLGNSISAENGERLTSLIRASGAQTPVVLIESHSANFNSLADATLKNDSSEILTGLRELLERTEKTGAVERTILYGNASMKAAAQR